VADLVADMMALETVKRQQTVGFSMQGFEILMLGNLSRSGEDV